MTISTTPWVLGAVLALGACIPACAQDGDFKPEFVGAEFTSRQVRPGDTFAMTLKFRNGGQKPARGDYRIFVHFEAPDASCENLVFQDDHEPAEPTSAWQPGQIILDGPRILSAPDDKPEQEYFVHVGIFDSEGTGERLLSTYDAGKIAVTGQAPPSDQIAPEPLSDQELTGRRAALEARIPRARRASLDGDTWRFDIDRESGSWQLVDKQTDVLWASDPARPVFGTIRLSDGETTAVWRVTRFDDIQITPTSLRLTTNPTVEGEPSGATVTFTVTPVQDPSGIKIAYETTAAGQWTPTRVSLLENALWTTDAEGGRVYVPQRLGIELPADKGLPGRQIWQTYNSMAMAMCGAEKQGSAILVNWESVDTWLRVDTAWPDLEMVPGRRSRAITIDMTDPAGYVTLHPLGEGNYVQIARAYRPLAKAKGWLQTWADKRERFPSVDKMFGAYNFKPFVFSRVVPGSRYNKTDEERTHLGFTFEEVAQCAEHWRHDLGIDRAYVVMAGWINRGYDVGHPDILPAAPECGGNEELQKAFARIKACGYLAGMHDNYQDAYKDAPSWDDSWINKDRRGRNKPGGNWNGGQAWQVCAIKQVELASRQATNLPEVDRLFDPTVYFIDTVFAWPLVTCEDPAHPMTRHDDLVWKSKLCMLAKEHFGMFGSEEGREWAVACADYQEGIFGHLTDSAPGEVIPLYELVYSDCTQIMTHQGNRIGPGNEKKMADHILFAEMGLPRFGEHLYWQGRQPSSGLMVRPLVPEVSDLGDRKFSITYRWKVDGPVDRDYKVFVHYSHRATTRPDGIAYQNDHDPQLPTSQWKAGTVVNDGPYTVEVPAEFDGAADILVGMTADGERAAFSGVGGPEGRYKVGVLQVTAEGIKLQPAEIELQTEIWSRSDGGWGQDLCSTDRVIKNTWEVLSPLNVLTAETPLADHEFLTEDRLLQRTRFGDLTITVAYDRPAKIGDNEVPAYGFIVDSPTFVAFCATRYGGIDYDTPALFTARSLDGRPLADSEQVRVYHGFGDAKVNIAGKTLEVQREAVVSLR